jgi:hypothetical protein
MIDTAITKYHFTHRKNWFFRKKVEIGCPVQIFKKNLKKSEVGVKKKEPLYPRNLLQTLSLASTETEKTRTLEAIKPLGTLFNLIRPALNKKSRPFSLLL